MAYIQMNLMSAALLRTVQVNAIVPIDKIQMPDKTEQAVIKKKGFKTLYLLHGIFGSQVDWINNTKLQLWAEEKNIVVIMPAGDNKFYLDIPEIRDYYGQFIGEELPQMMSELFPISTQREDTFIGGLSMGGYGALRNGLKYNQRFGGIAALSPGNPLYGDNELLYKMMGDEFINLIFGEESKRKESDKNIEYLIKQNVSSGNEKQKIYLSCGTEDRMLDVTRRTRDLFEEYQYDLSYCETPGGHEWDFWNEQIKKVIDWIEPDNGVMGVTSGNVGL